MNRNKLLKLRFQTVLAGVATLIIVGGPGSNLFAGDANTTPAPTNSVATAAPPAEAKTPPLKKQLTGAELYSMHCNRCHPERYPTERTAAQWKTITLHMQVRAAIPGNQARLILQYLQENSGR